MRFESIFNEAHDSAKTPRQQYELYLKWATYSRVFPETMDAAEYESKSAKIDKNLQQLCTWLNSSGFYEAPASTRYHEPYTGGLRNHTLRVVRNIETLHKLPQFEDVDLASAVLVALVHDWCKIGMYTSYEKNVKDEYGNWVKQTAFKLSDTLASAFGHGVSSMYLAGKWFNLTEEEALAIRWHMGPWRAVDSESNELQFANENYPLVHMLQFADQLAIVNYNKINNL